MFDANRFISARARGVDASGIRRVFDLAATLADPVNLSIGQPDFDVPQAVKDAAIAAINSGMNRYTQTQGIAALQSRVGDLITRELPNWSPASKTNENGFATLITSGVSGGLMLAIMACVGPGDEVLIPDPYFVMYKHLVTLAGATPVFVDTYPDFQLTAAQLEARVTPRTRMLLFNSPSNPTGVVATQATCQVVAAFCDKHNLLLLSDEIYDEFCFEKSPCHDGVNRCPSPARFSDHLLLLRGFSKTYGMTGWRLGWAAGPKAIIEQMTKLQPYSFVCAPSMAQMGGLEAMNVDMSAQVEAYRLKRDLVTRRLAEAGYELTTPGGAFYAFPKVPQKLGLTATQFVERAVAQSLLIIPGNVFSSRDTHFRISYACDDATLNRGLDILATLAK